MVGLLVWLSVPLFAQEEIEHATGGSEASASVLESAQICRERGRRGLEEWTRRVVEDPTSRLGEHALEALGVSVRALTLSDPSLQNLVRAGRERLRAQQNADGSFGRSIEARSATYALMGAFSETDTAYQKALAFLLRSLRSPTALPQDPNVKNAMEFLERRSGARGAPVPLPVDRRELWLAFVDSKDDVRTTYRTLRLSFEQVLIRPLVTPDSLRRLHLEVQVLDSYHSPWLVTSRGSRHWPRALAEKLYRSCGEEDGLWGDSLATDASALATGYALLLDHALRPWLTGTPLPARYSDEELVYAELNSDCEGCHRRLQPHLVEQWEKSPHAESRVGCAGCHGENHSKMFREKGRVSPSVCGECHARQVKEFARSRHAKAEETLVRSALFHSTPPAARTACLNCHAIGARHVDGSSGSCHHCHSGHQFLAAQAKEPEACTVCHTGADYPQDRAYELSKHGVLYLQTRDPAIAPSCVTCHNPGGTHDDSFGMTIGGIGVGAILEGTDPPIPMPSISTGEFHKGRAEMVDVCADCHSRRFSRDTLAAADQLKSEGDAHLRQAVQRLRTMASRLPNPASLGPFGGEQVRLPHSVVGAEAMNMFYDMWRFHYASTWKGAYHNSPSVANLQSRPGLEHDLERIRAACERVERSESKE